MTTMQMMFGALVSLLCAVSTITAAYMIYTQQRRDRSQEIMQKRMIDQQAERDQKQDEILKTFVHGLEEMWQNTNQSLHDFAKETAQTNEKIAEKLQATIVELTSLRGEVSANKQLCDQHVEHCRKQREER